MTYLTEHLPFASGSGVGSGSGSGSGTNQALPPAGSHLLVTDTISSPAHFVLYHLVSAAILDKRKVIWADLRGEGRSNLESALKKAGTTIPTGSKMLATISPSSLPSLPSGSVWLFDNASRPTLRPTYDAIRKELSTGPPALVILDGLAELTYMGFEPAEIHQFARAVLGFVRQNASSLVSITHADQLPLLASSPPVNPSSPQIDLLYRLMRMSNAMWRVSGLSSGRSGNVSGEISSHNLSTLTTSDKKGIAPSVPRSRPLQYRLEANTVKLFAKGTGRGYL